MRILALLALILALAGCHMLRPELPPWARPVPAKSEPAPERPAGGRSECRPRAGHDAGPSTGAGPAPGHAASAAASTRSCPRSRRTASAASARGHAGSSRRRSARRARPPRQVPR